MLRSRPRREESRPPRLPDAPELFSAVLDAVDGLVVVTSIHSGRVVVLNAAAEKLIGLPRQQVLGRPLVEICSPEDRGAVADLLAPPVRGDLPRCFAATTAGDAGVRAPVLWSLTYLTDAAGRHTHLVMTGADVSGGGAVGSLFEQLMEAATTIVLIGTDRGGRIIFCSSGAEQVLGRSREELVGRCLPAAAFGAEELSTRIAGVAPAAPAQVLDVEVSSHDRRSTPQLDLGPPDRRTDRRSDERRGSGSDEDWQRPRDWTVTHADGSRVVAEMTVTPVTDALVEGAGYLLLGHDVTAQRRSKDLLVSSLAKETAAAARLREVDRMKDDIVANVSHELRTPLTSILGYVEILQDEEAGPLTPEQRRLVSVIERSGDRLLSLIEDLLTVSTIDAGKLQSTASRLDLRDVVTIAFRNLRPMLGERHLTTSLDLGPAPVVVRGDPGQLEQVVSNLLSNAIKFTEDGGTVGCCLQVAASRARLTVSDDGIGIPEEEQPGMFTRFFRSTTAKDRAIPGTGLGLSIVASIVASHGGEVSVVSASGRGTEVTVDLPIARSRAV